MLKFFVKKGKEIKTEEIDQEIIDLIREVPIIKSLPSLEEVEDITKFNVKYILIKGFAYANIYWDPELNFLRYDVIEPRLSKKELYFLKFIKEKLFETIDLDLSEIGKKKVGEYLFKKIKDITEESRINIPEFSFYKIFYYIFRDTVGLGKIEPLMHDPYIEDISCDGVGIPVYVYHRKYGHLRTNIIFRSEPELQSFIIVLAQRTGRYISYAEPYLDAILPDGSRVNATFSSDVTTKGPTFTIRKFRRDPYTPLDLIRFGTMNLEMASYLWWAIEHKANIIIGGETASGKTTLLNALSMFIPQNFKIISIEDTREIQLYHENWIPAVTREGYGPPDEHGRRYGEITMYDLLKESFRQNPDYVLVGEVRGKEAYVLFQGMASGHACMGTIHADSVESVVRRLITPPINLPIELLENIDLFIFMVHAKEINPAARRVREIDEVSEIDIKSGRIEVNKAFVWAAKEDKFIEDDIKILFQRLADRRGIKIGNIEKDIEQKKKFLSEMLRKDIRDPKEFFKWVSEYYINKRRALRKIKNA